MHATVRRYESVDLKAKDELTRKINESLIPELTKLPGFAGYWVIESDNGVFTSFGVFGSEVESGESNRVAANWVRDQKLEATLPNPPKITSGEVIALKNGGMIQA